MSSKDTLSSRAVNVGLFSLVVAITLALGEGYFRGYVVNELSSAHLTPALTTMFVYWCFGLRNVAENIIWAAAVIFVGARFFESRTILSVGFDKIDASAVSIKGPDENNTVLVGHRYGTKLEAESVALAMESRLKASAD